MTEKYRVRLPWELTLFKYGIVFVFRRPIIKTRSRPPVRPEDSGSISIFLTMLDEDN
jgi:hypothetical protein